jgi:hypothetical protein
VDSLRKKFDRLSAGIRSLRVMYASNLHKTWYAPNSYQELVQASRYLEQAERRSSKVPYLLDHGATKMGAKMIHRARESFTCSHSIMKRLPETEDRFRLQVTEEIHLS